MKGGKNYPYIRDVLLARRAEATMYMYDCMKKKPPNFALLTDLDQQQHVSSVKCLVPRVNDAAGLRSVLSVPQKPIYTHIHTLTHAYTRVFFSPSLSILREFFCCSCFSLFDTLFPFFDALFTVGFFIFWYFFHLPFFFLFHFLSPPPSLSLYQLCILRYFQGGGKEFSGIKHILPNFFERR